MKAPMLLPLSAVAVVVSPDNRRAGKSEEDIHYWGRVDAEDGYDVIEWTA